MKQGYRIISIEAADIYRHEQENGVSVGYKMPESKSDAYFRLFKIYLDNSLDSVELEKAYKRVCRKKFSFQDKSGNGYTLAVINLKFNYTYKPENGKPIKIKDLRSHFYEKGFYLDGIHYVRYKRSAGSSREGKCLFIDERLYKAMDKWSGCGLKSQTDLASWESYKALSLSSIKGTVNIPLDGILFVPDYKSVFTEEVISVELKDSKLVAEQKQTEITNDIWDGESLLDESVFENGYADKHMLLLRNKFFKSCAFRTKLQKWIKDKNITLDDIKKRGFTLATDVSQIVMVEKILEIYNDVCKLAVLSGLEIDKAKRAYDNVNVGKELSALRKKYNRPAPIFFKEIDEKGKENEYAFYDTAMDYIYQAVKKFNFLKGKRKRINYMPISWVVGDKTTSENATDYRHRDKIIEICEEYRTRIDRLYMELRIADDQEREVIYDNYGRES